MRDFQIVGNPLTIKEYKDLLYIINKKKTHKMEKMEKELNDIKLCPDCNTEKSINEFITGNRKISRCKICQNALRCKQYRERKEQSKNILKTCKECNIEKNGSDFGIGYNICKVCFGEKHKEANNRPSETDPDKTCRVCNITKSATMFRKREFTCKECSKQNLYKWRENNKERFLQICKNYRDKDEKKELRRNYLRKKYNNEIEFRLELLYRHRIRLCVKNKYLPKNTSLKYEKILGCSWKIFIKWLEFNMTPEMSLDNYGSYWHIDHVYPCSLFDFSIESNRTKCFNWTNLTPLKGIDNIKKSNKLNINLITHYKKRAIEFIQQNQDIELLTDALPDDIKLLVESGALTTKGTVKAVPGSGEKLERR